MRIKKVVFSFLFLILSVSLWSQEKIKNVIVMIPDGCSISLVSLSRYYEQWRTGDPNFSLAIDPYFCGLVRSTCSNAPIGDSAPTGSCYFNGQPAQKGNIGIYPQKTDQDLYEIDSSRAYFPLATLMEVAKLEGKSTGIVATSQFTHATPASTSAHYYDRNAEEIIAKQMVYNHIDVVLAGGTKYLQPHIEYLTSRGYDIIRTKEELYQTQSPKYWGVFDSINMPCFIDQKDGEFPSLAEMTQKAIETLSQNDQGFFLMVEGSLIDWAMHNLDAKTGILEFLEFDKAVDVAIQFAIADQHTLVVIVPDHGTSGISIGGKNTNSGYAKKSLDQFFQPFEEQDHALTKKDTLLRAKLELTSLISFTTFGHTGEDLLLAIYHPNQKAAMGHCRNYEITEYIVKELGWNQLLNKTTESIYKPHYQVYNHLTPTIYDQDLLSPTLTYKDKRNQITYYGNTNYAIKNGEIIEFESVIIYIDKIKTFFIPNRRQM